jgi:rhomboid family GlyGly-CTERM serine protease
MLLGDSARQRLRFDRSALEAGQWWRVFTAHVVHLGATHTLMNLAGFGLVVVLFRHDLRIREWIGGGLAAAAAIGIGLYTLSPETVWYVGLSGVLHGWFALGALRVTETQRGFGLLLVGAIIVKLAYEQARGANPATLALHIGPVVVDAHLYGAIGAAAFYIGWRAGSLAAGASRSL